MEANEKVQNNTAGSVRISDEVIMTLAGKVTLETKGIAALSQGVVGGIAERLGRKNLGKGIRVEQKDDVTNVDISVIMEFGARIPDVATTVQEGVKHELEELTGLHIGKVNVHVEGVQAKKEDLVKEAVLSEEEASGEE